MTCPHCHNIRTPSLLAILGLLAVIATAVVVTKHWPTDRPVAAPPAPSQPTRILWIDTPQTPIEIVETPPPPQKGRR